MFNCIVISGISFSPNTANMQCHLNLWPTSHVKLSFYVTLHSWHPMLDPMTDKIYIGKFSCLRLSTLPPYPYIRLCPDILPANRRRFPRSHPTCPPFRQSALGFLSCPVILSATPTPQRPPYSGPMYYSPLPLPWSCVITFASGSVVPVTWDCSSA